MNSSKSGLFVCAAAALWAVCVVPASAEVARDAEGAGQSSTTEVQAVIVTAQNRSENVNTVPISISAASGDQLRQRAGCQAGGLFA